MECLPPGFRPIGGCIFSFGGDFVEVEVEDLEFVVKSVMKLFSG